VQLFDCVSERKEGTRRELAYLHWIVQNVAVSTRLPCCCMCIRFITLCPNSVYSGNFRVGFTTGFHDLFPFFLLGLLKPLKRLLRLIAGIMFLCLCLFFWISLCPKCLWLQGHSLVSARKRTANRGFFNSAKARSGCSVLDQKLPSNSIGNWFYSQRLTCRTLQKPALAKDLRSANTKVLLKALLAPHRQPVSLSCRIQIHLQRRA